MSDQAKFKKMLEILLSLNGSFGKSIEELAERFDVSERTIYRYLDTFEEAGFVIENHNGYRRIDKQDPYSREISELLHFSEEEAFILGKAIHQISAEDPLREQLVKKLYSLYNFDRVANTIIKPEETDKVHSLLKAINNQTQAVLTNYRSGSSQTVSDRHVEPFDFTPNYTGVVCYDYEDGRCKIFKTSRIDKVYALCEPWEHAEKHMKVRTDVFRHQMTNSIAVHLRLSLLACNLLKEEFPLSEKHITARDDGRFDFKADVGNLLGVGRFVLGLPGEVEVIGGEELKRYVSAKRGDL